MFVFVFLVSDVLSDNLLVSANGRHVITTRPKVHAAVVLPLPQIGAGNVYSALTFYKTNDLGNGVLWWNRYQYVDMIRL